MSPHHPAPGPQHQAVPGWDNEGHPHHCTTISLALPAFKKKNVLYILHVYCNLVCIADFDIQVYDAINEDTKLPNIEYPDTDATKAIVEFHACKFGLGMCEHEFTLTQRF